jgi:hypothetical protein
LNKTEKLSIVLKINPDTLEDGIITEFRKILFSEIHMARISADICTENCDSKNVLK